MNGTSHLIVEFGKQLAGSFDALLSTLYYVTTVYINSW